MMERKLFLSLGIFLVLIVSLFSVSAFGVTTPYWNNGEDNHPLRLSPGESKIVNLGLQNAVGDENVTLRAVSFESGPIIVEFLDDNLDYFVPLGVEVSVPVKIEVPEGVNLGGVYDVSISFKQISNDDASGGFFQLSGNVVTRFPVEVVSEENSELYGVDTGGSFPWFIVAVIVILVAAGFVFFRNKHLN